MAKLSANGREIARFEKTIDGTGDNDMLEFRQSLRRIDSRRSGSKLVILQQTRWKPTEGTPWRDGRWSSWKKHDETAWVKGDAAETVMATKVERTLAWFERRGWTRTDI